MRTVLIYKCLGEFTHNLGKSFKITCKKIMFSKVAGSRETWLKINLVTGSSMEVDVLGWLNNNLTTP